MNPESSTRGEPIRIRVIEARQPIGPIYVGVANAFDIAEISRADQRALMMTGSDRKGDEFYEYTGIQRLLDPSREKEIKDYVKTVDASFPNSIILAIKPESIINYDHDKGELVIERDPRTAMIIDGQHRLAGFHDNRFEADFDLILAIFIDIEMEEAAYLFSTINTKHVKMNQSLAKDLLEFSSVETPEKVAHNIAKKFNKDEDSPWHGKIKMLGRKDELSPDAFITQHAFTTEIIDLMYDKKYQISVRNTLKVHDNKREKLAHDKLLKIDGKRYPLWQLYLQNEEGSIYKLLFNYFSALREVFPKEFDSRLYILNKTTGYYAFMRVLRGMIKPAIDERKIGKDRFLPTLRQAKKILEERHVELTNEYFKAGSQGRIELTRTLAEVISEF